MKLRADLLLVQQNLVPSRARAQALIMAGKVSTSKGRVEKAGELIDENETLILEEDLKYVSRGGLKLEGALQSLHINPQGKICLDVGASTGGFTDCLLQGGAVKVYAVDVGYGQLHYKLREDSRVVMMEKVNFRHFDVNTLEKMDLVVSDVSFISLTKVLENIHASLKEDGEALVMVKPQFELGPQEVKKGVVRSESLREKAVTLVADFAQKIGFTLLGKSPSPVLGPKGNQEIFLHLKKLKALALLIVMLMSACTSTYKTSRHSPRSKVPSGQAAADYFILSEIDYRHNRFKQSMTNLNSAIEKAEVEHDTSDYLRFKRAYLSASLNDLKSAEQDARKALQESPQNVNYLVLMGKISHGQQRWPEALNYYESALKLNSQSSEAHSLLIEVLLAQKNYTKALESSRLWQKQDPDDVTPYFYEASLLQNFLNRPQEAVKIYQHILQDDPDSMKALSALADLYVDLKDQKKLLETFHEMEELAPADPGIKIKLALIYYENKDYEKAIQKFEELKKLSPDDDRVIYYLAVMKENTGQGDDAYPLFEQISPKSTFYRDARLHMAFIKKEKGDAVSAIAILEKARKEKKMEPVVTQYLAEIYRDQGKYDKSLSILDESLEQNDKQRSVEDKTLLLYTRGITLDKAGRYDDAIVTMLKILQLDPKNVSALNYVGYTYAEQNKNLDQALDFVAMAYAQKPDDGYIMDSLGWVYFKKGSLEKALNLILKAQKCSYRADDLGAFGRYLFKTQ
ncbi:MAG: tetratricopeptide repeat protein [Deltaproteobacteria bacterium]|nr:MAG: tetratricopeptide repeat protein [Deltaproteobacteria bacterium]